AARAEGHLSPAHAIAGQYERSCLGAFAAHALLGDGQGIWRDIGPDLGVDVGSGDELAVGVLDDAAYLADLPGPERGNFSGRLIDGSGPTRAGERIPSNLH